jgi:signal transduction histidine kinase
VVELLLELGQTAVPDGVKVNVQTQGARRSLLGYYDPLRRAFSNLLRNASEAMHGQGAIDITVTGNGTSGEISAHPLIVTISDHGQGIPSDLRQRVFEPYFTTKTDGTGLGLALVRQTLEAHGGSIDAGETPGGGATFTLTFPA